LLWGSATNRLSPGKTPSLWKLSGKLEIIGRGSPNGCLGEAHAQSRTGGTRGCGIRRRMQDGDHFPCCKDSEVKCSKLKAIYVDYSILNEHNGVKVGFSGTQFCEASEKNGRIEFCELLKFQ
jgi:hypothetical protein